MQLIRLSANQPSFRTVDFRASGPTFIVGRKKNTTEKKKDDTYNGVGKSLLLYLVNFCFCSQPKDELAEKLPGWIFTIDFQLEGKLHSISRSTDGQNEPTLDGIVTTIDQCRQWLGREAFGLAENVPYLTFRTLIGQFLRSGKAAYQTFDRLNFSERPIQKIVRMGLLLGLDLDLIQNKFNLKEQLDHAVEMNNNFSRDPLVRDYFLGEKDISIELKDLESTLGRLERDHANFRVAENYSEVEREANSVRHELQGLRNEEYSAEGAVTQIAASLEQKVEVDEKQLTELYSAAAVALPEQLVASLNEVAEFHKNLITTRQKRLTGELNQIRAALKNVKERQNRLNAELNDKVKFLNAHGAFSEYVALSERLASKRSEVEKLREFHRMTKAFKEQARALKLQLSSENIKAAEYLENHEEEISEVSDLFWTFTKRIYPGKKSGLVISNNEGENQTRFDIAAKILDDASDGINEVKIFCFDLTVLLARRNHNVNFLFHDSRLFSDIDPRQRTELFRIAAEYSSQGRQYIATLNEDVMEAMREWMSPEEFKSIIEDNVVLELTDESPAAKLLGVEVDLDYK